MVTFAAVVVDAVPAKSGLPITLPPITIAPPSSSLFAIQSDGLSDYIAGYVTAVHSSGFCIDDRCDHTLAYGYRSICTINGANFTVGYFDRGSCIQDIAYITPAVNDYIGSVYNVTDAAECTVTFLPFARMS